MSSEFFPLAEVNDASHDLPAPEEPPLDDRLLAHWALDGLEDDVTISDDSDITFIRAQDGRQALMYSGTRDASSSESAFSARIPAFNVDSTSFTVCLWFWLSDNCDVLLLADAATPRQFSIKCLQESLHFVLKGETGNDVLSIKGSKIPTGKWCHIAFVWDCDLKQGELFVDGHSVAMGTSQYPESCLAQVCAQRFVLAYLQELHEILYNGTLNIRFGMRELLVFGCALTREQISGAMLARKVNLPRYLPESKFQLVNEADLVERFSDLHEYAEISLDFNLGLNHFTVVFECIQPRRLLRPVNLLSQSSADHDLRVTWETNGLISVRLHVTKNDFQVTYTSKTPIADETTPVGFTWDSHTRKGVFYINGEDESAIPCTDKWADSLDDRCRELYEERQARVQLVERYIEKHMFSADDICVTELRIAKGVLPPIFFEREYLQRKINDAYSPEEAEKNITPYSLCSYENPMIMAFRLQSVLRKRGRDDLTWAQQRFDDLADSVEQFAVDFIGQTEGEGSMEFVDETIQQALLYEQKKFLAQPNIHRLVERQWSGALFGDAKKFNLLMFLLIVLESLFYPFLLPLYCCTCSDSYFTFMLNPVVRFTKDLLSQLAFIGLHMAVCLSPSSVQPIPVDDMWNYLDMAIILCYITIVIVRIVTMAKSGPVQGNNLLAGVMYLYGINTLFLILRLSSVLELNRTTGPLQLALMRMLVDLWVIIVQFVVVILAFSFAITKIYFAQRDLALGHAQANVTYSGFCPFDGGNCLEKTAESLVWSLFGLTDLDSIATNDKSASSLVYYLYAIFLVICVIMLLNTLVALLNSTYEDIKSNSDTEWKFVRALYTDQYNRCHPFPPPINLVTVPLAWLLEKLRNADCVKRMAEDSKYGIIRHYAKNILNAGQPPDHVHGEVFLRFVGISSYTRWSLSLCYWENTKKRYLEKFGEHFPGQDDANIAKVYEELVNTRDRVTRLLATSLSEPTSPPETWRTSRGMLVRNSLLMRTANEGHMDAHVNGCPSYGQGIPAENAIAHNMTPLTEKNPSFEVYIKHVDDVIEMFVGVVPEGYPLCEPPGLIAGSVAYLAKDSGIVMTGASFDKVDGVEQKCKRVQFQCDDIIRCTLDFGSQSNYSVPISFEVNRKRLWSGVVHFQHRVPVSLYPCIAIGSPGLTVVYQGSQCLGSYNQTPPTKDNESANVAFEPSGDATGIPALRQQIDVRHGELQSRLDRLERSMEALLGHVTQIAKGRREEAEPADK
ncbi:uncharacterized protein LOC5515228 isoform X2 [Nematostella vectensis]|uniref:uncharacterized protein LOC5515228 isoform X2 n=1 Tax=Nematostella vectensis TaxID=45351 RepID=UPI002076D8A3|nr:uncharacterized protein LOC5515228 isoform X2 [Nematostella vectensis]